MGKGREIVKGSCMVWREVRGEAKGKVSVTSSGEAWEAEVTGRSTGSPEKEVKGVEFEQSDIKVSIQH